MLCLQQHSEAVCLECADIDLRRKILYQWDLGEINII